MPSLTLQRGSCLPRNWVTIMPLSRINGKKKEQLSSYAHTKLFARSRRSLAT